MKIHPPLQSSVNKTPVETFFINFADLRTHCDLSAFFLIS